MREGTPDPFHLLFKRVELADVLRCGAAARESSRRCETLLCRFRWRQINRRLGANESYAEEGDVAGLASISRNSHHEAMTITLAA